MIELYDYQNDCVAATRRAIAEGHKNILVQSPTGSGKTVIFSYIAKNAIQKGGRVLILTDRIELLTETGGTLSQFAIKNQLVTAGQMAPPPPYWPCFVGMAQTLARRITPKKYPQEWAAWFASFTIVIVDECHKQTFNPFFETGNLFNGATVLGFTATPSRMGKMRQLGEDYSKMIEGLQVQELINRGKLLPDRYYTVLAPQKTTYKLNNRGDDFDENDMFKAFDRPEFYEGAIEAYKTHAPGTTNLVFCCNIQHVIKTCEEFNAAGIPAKFLTSAVPKPKRPENETPAKMARYERDLERYNNWAAAYAKYSGERKQLLKEWKRGDFKVMINAGILTTGFNFPALQTVQVLRATVSVPLWLQIIGRGSRIHPGKEYFNILDHGRNGERLGRYRDNRVWSLIHKESKGGGAAPVKECGEGQKPDKKGRKGCGAYINASVTICPFCGYTYPTEKERIKAELQLLSYDILPTPGAPVKKQFEFEEIERTAISRGYKEGWTVRQIAMQHGIEGLQRYGKTKGYSKGWAFMTYKRLGVR